MSVGSTGVAGFSGELPGAAAKVDRPIKTDNTQDRDANGQQLYHRERKKEKMSDEEMMQFKQFVMDAYQKGQIDLSDVLMVWFLKDYKQAVALFNIKRSKQMAQQAQMAQQQFQLQQQQMQAQMALTAQLKQMEYQTAMRNTDVKAQSLIASEQEKNRGKIAAAQVDGFNKHKNTAMQGDIDAFLERQRNLQPNSSQ